jgi:thiaminase/transcriptional activator TenA
MARIYRRLREAVDSVWRKIFEHPFVLELYSGRLPLEKFRFYVVQDYNYLVTMMKVFSILAAKSDPAIARLFIELAREEATTEMENYHRLVRELGMTLNDVVKAEPAPTNVSYMSFLLATCSLGGVDECLVAILPCFASYAEIAEKHRNLLERNPVKLYREWASIYLSNEYRSLVEKLIKIFEEVASNVRYETYYRIFLTASRYEYMFWDMAYKLEGWPV